MWCLRCHTLAQSCSAVVFCIMSSVQCVRRRPCLCDEVFVSEWRPVSCVLLCTSVIYIFVIKCSHSHIHKIDMVNHVLLDLDVCLRCLRVACCTLFLVTLRLRRVPPCPSRYGGGGGGKGLSGPAAGGEERGSAAAHYKKFFIY